MSIAPGVSLHSASSSSSSSVSVSVSVSDISPSVPLPLPAPPSSLCPSASASVPVDLEDLVSVQSRITRRLPPIVPALCPFRRHLVPGATYLYCACGRSQTQPWCDDSHLPSDPQPISFTVPPSKSGYSLICGCKYTANPPFCDGSHIHPHKGTEEE